MVAGDTAESRAHPDSMRDVWEIAIWDPTPISLQLFCLLSPGHVLVYWSLLPVAVDNPYPSVTVATTILVAAIISAQLLLLQKSFSRQSKDSSLIHKEVMNEYDTKFVHPRSQPLMRDVGTQVMSHESAGSRTTDIDDDDLSVETYTPAFVINRGFQTRPNPNYIQHIDPESSKVSQTPSRASTTVLSPILQTPNHLRNSSSPVRPQTALRQPQFRSSQTGDGGSLGVYSHARSPLRKSASTQFSASTNHRQGPSNGIVREGSPLKENFTASSTNHQRFAAYKDTPARRASGRF